MSDRKIPDNPMASLSTRFRYDPCAYRDRTKQSTDPLLHMIDPIQVNSCNKCYPLYGPIGSFMNVSTPSNANLVDVESMLSRRNTKASYCAHGQVTDIDVNALKLNHLPPCTEFLDRQDTRLTHPITNYKELNLDNYHFQWLNKDPQCNIFWDFAENTQLSTRDAYRHKIPSVMDERALPDVRTGRVAVNPATINTL